MNAPKETPGLDPGKRSPGRKRAIATEVLGLVIAVVVAAASVHDITIGIVLLDKAAAAPTVTKAWTDAGFKNAVVEHGARIGIDVEVVHREPGQNELSLVEARLHEGSVVGGGLSKCAVKRLAPQRGTPGHRPLPLPLLRAADRHPRPS